MSKTAGQPEAVILFDGYCRLCDASVGFILRRDRKGRFRFAPLQSAAAKELLAPVNGPQEGGSAETDSVVLIEGGRSYVKSAAVLRIVRRLGGLWPVLWLAVAIPRPVRDALYDWVARNRAAWFGRRESCRFPTEEERARFLDGDLPG